MKRREIGTGGNDIGEGYRYGVMISERAWNMGAKWMPKTGGRQKGSLNKATKDVKEAARELAPKALKRIETLSRDKNPQVSLAACKEILDRAYGKAVQHLEGEISIYDKLTLEEKEALLEALDASIDDEEGDANDEATRH